MRKIIEALEKVRGLERKRRVLLESGAIRVVSEDSSISDTEKRELKELIRKTGQVHPNS